MKPKKTHPPRPRARPSAAMRRSARPAPRRAAKVAPKVPLDRTGPLHVEIIAIGRELVRGRLPDQNATYLAGWFSMRGAVVHRITLVDSQVRPITSAISGAIERGAQLVVTTGGLGPTSDDRTLAGVSDAVRLPLVLHPQARTMVEDTYRDLQGRRLTSSAGLNAAREKMCMLPVGSEALPNAVGIAPGVLIRLPGSAAILCLPGVPAETRAVFEAGLNRLKDLAPKGATASREVESPTLDESSLRPLLDRLVEEFPLLWIRSSSPGLGHPAGRVRVILEAGAPTRNEAESVVEIAFQRLLGLSGSV